MRRWRSRHVPVDSPASGPDRVGSVPGRAITAMYSSTDESIVADYVAGWISPPWGLSLSFFWPLFVLDVRRPLRWDGPTVPSTRKQSRQFAFNLLRNDLVEDPSSSRGFTRSDRCWLIPRTTYVPGPLSLSCVVTSAPPPTTYRGRTQPRSLQCNNRFL